MAGEERRLSGAPKDLPATGLNSADKEPQDTIPEIPRPTADSPERHHPSTQAGRLSAWPGRPPACVQTTGQRHLPTSQGAPRTIPRWTFPQEACPARWGPCPGKEQRGKLGRGARWPLPEMGPATSALTKSVCVHGEVTQGGHKCNTPHGDRGTAVPGARCRLESFL